MYYCDNCDKEIALSECSECPDCGMNLCNACKMTTKMLLRRTNHAFLRGDQDYQHADYQTLHSISANDSSWFAQRCICGADEASEEERQCWFHPNESRSGCGDFSLGSCISSADAKFHREPLV